MRTGTDRVEESVQLATRARIFAETYNGGDYFKDLSLFLRDLLKVRHVLLARVSGNQLIAEAFCTDGTVSGNFSCDLNASVFEEVRNSQTCYQSGGFREILLNHPFFNELGISNFMGTPLYGSSSTISGLLAVMDRKNLENPDAIELTFAAVMSRTAREIAGITENVINSR